MSSNVPATSISVGIGCHPDFYSLYLGQVIRVFEIGEYVIPFHGRSTAIPEPQRDRTEGGEDERVEYRKGSHLAKSGFRISPEIGK